MIVFISSLFLDFRNMSLAFPVSSAASGSGRDWQIPVSKRTVLMKLKLFSVWFYIQLRISFVLARISVCVCLCVFVYIYVCLPCGGFTGGGDCKCACSFLMVSLYKSNIIDLEGKRLAKNSSNGLVLSKFNRICFGQQLHLWEGAIHLLRNNHEKLSKWLRS